MNALIQLPEPERLKEIMIVQSILSTILCEEDWLRYHSFDPEWAEEVSMAKIDNGSGDHLFILFSNEGTIIKGFDHESPLSPHAQDEYAVLPGIYDHVPSSLLSLLDDEALEREDVTFCIWRENNDVSWNKGKVNVVKDADDGSGFLLGTIYETAEDFVGFAEHYYELSLPLEIVKKVYAGEPVTISMIHLLNPSCDAEKVYQKLLSSS